MKKISLIIILVILPIILLVYFTNGDDSSNGDKIVSNGKVVKTGKMKHKKCSRSATADELVVSLNYDLYYVDDELKILKSVEKVASENQDKLAEYEVAYNRIHSHYRGLEYYDTTVERDEVSVTSTIVINYEKIDIGMLLDIEGEEDNIIENGTAKVEKWLSLAKKLGTECEDVEDE